MATWIFQDYFINLYKGLLFMYLLCDDQFSHTAPYNTDKYSWQICMQLQDEDEAIDDSESASDVHSGLLNPRRAPGPRDVSAYPGDGPTQPILHSYPVTVLGKKTII